MDSKKKHAAMKDNAPIKKPAGGHIAELANKLGTKVGQKSAASTNNVIKRG